MNNIIFKSLLFYIFLFLIKKVNYEIKFLKNRLFNRILYRKKIKSFENFIQENIKFWRTKPRSYSEEKILICNYTKKFYVIMCRTQIFYYKIARRKLK